MVNSELLPCPIVTVDPSALPSGDDDHGEHLLEVDPPAIGAAWGIYF